MFKRLMARELRSNFQIPENFEFPEVLPRTRRQQRTMADPNVAAVVVAIQETWHVNPYNGNFNPSTKPGQEIFEKKTKGLPADERFTATKKDSQEIFSYFKHNLHSWEQWLLVYRKNMMPRAM